MKSPNVHVGNDIKKLHLQYVSKHNKLTQRYKVYRVFTYKDNGKDVVYKRQLVKKNLTKFEHDNLLYLLQK